MTLNVDWCDVEKY